MVTTMKNRYAKLKADIYAHRGDPESWIEINSSFKGKIVAEDKEYVILSNNSVEIRVKKTDIIEIDEDEVKR